MAFDSVPFSLYASALALILWFACVSAKSVPSNFYGVVAGSGLPSYGEMSRGGISFVRDDCAWSSVEPNPPVRGKHTYNWADYDAFVSTLAKHGLTWYPILEHPGPWAAAAWNSPPRSNRDYALFCKAFAERYGPRGRFWAENPRIPKHPTTHYEIWNEWNNGMFWTGSGASTRRYLSMYLAAHSAIHSLHRHAVVVVGGILDAGYDGGQALSSLLSLAGKRNRGKIDAVGWHPYKYQYGAIIASLKKARHVLNHHGLHHVPIEINEVGWFVQYSHMSMAASGSALKRLAMRAPHLGLKISRLIAYDWYGDAQDYQLTKASGALTPFGKSYLSGIAAARHRHH